MSAPAPAAAPATAPAAAPAAAPSAAPAAPAAPAEPPPAAPAPAEPAAPAVFEPTGDAGLDLAASWITGLGLNAESPEVVAFLQGNSAFLKAKLASMGDKARGWEQYIALGEQGLSAIQTAATEKASATAATVHEVAGGEEQWNAIAKWAGENADPAEKEAINAMFDQGGIHARAAAMLLVNLYNHASGTVVEPASATAAAPASAAAQTGALSPADYRTAISELSAKIGAANVQDSPEYATLVARRRAYRG